MSKAFFLVQKKKEENKRRNYLFLLLPRVFSPCLCASPFFTPELPHFWARTDLHQPSVLLSLLLRADQGQSGVHCCSCFVRSSLLFFQSTSGLREEARRPGKEADVFLFVPDQLKSPEKPPFSPENRHWSRIEASSSRRNPASSGRSWGTESKLLICVLLFLNQF